MEMDFEWDLAKAESNLHKHGIRFETAALVFKDPFHLSVQVSIENAEYRWQTIGAIEGCVVVLVVHTLRFESGTEIVRIISARKACRKERKIYEYS